MSQVLIFGSSSTQGYWDEEGGWADRLKRYILQSLLPDAKKEIDVFNLGIASNSSKEILERFNSEAKKRMRFPKTLFIFGFGGNDSQFLDNTQATRTAPDVFSKNITLLIQQAKKYSSLIAFIGLHPVNEARTNPIPWETNINFRNNLIEQYNDIIENVCKKEQVHFIEIYGTKTNYLQFVSKDGLHPNSEGHKKIFEIVKKYLISHNIISSL